MSPVKLRGFAHLVASAGARGSACHAPPGWPGVRLAIPGRVTAVGEHYSTMTVSGASEPPTPRRLAPGKYGVVTVGVTVILPLHGTRPRPLSIEQAVASVVVQASVDISLGWITVGVAVNKVIFGGGQVSPIMFWPQLFRTLPQTVPSHGS